MSTTINRNLKVPDKAEGDAKRDEMYALNPTCGHCWNKIETIDEASALYYTIRRAWKLVHRTPCLADAILSQTAPRRLPS